MSVQLAAEIWNLVKDSIPYDDRDQMADTFVGLMVDHGYALEEIRDEFVNDSEILKVVKYYADEGDSYQEESYDDADEDEDEDW